MTLIASEKAIEILLDYCAGVASGVAAISSVLTSRVAPHSTGSACTVARKLGAGCLS